MDEVISSYIKQVMKQSGSEQTDAEGARASL